MPMDANRITLPDYQYNLYNNYLDQMGDMLIKYGKATGMPIQYWHIRVDLSLNYDDLKMQNAYKHYVYDLLHFVPTLNATPINYQIGYNQQQQGTSNVGSGTFNMYLIRQPLPGDLFKYYSQNGETDPGEIFRVTGVRYMRTSKGKLKLYQIDFETAQILLETLNHVRINTIQCWNSELYRFLTEEECNAMQTIPDERKELVDKINKWYDNQNGWYGRCDIGQDHQNPEFTCGLSDKTPRPFVFLNTIIKRLKKLFPTLDTKPIYGIGTAKIALNWILQPENYWDTFTCLSFQPNANAGEIFNATAIFNDQCVDCPPELVQEVKCHQELYNLVKELVQLLLPLIRQEELDNNTCDRNCCNSMDPNYIQKCVLETSDDYELFWDSSGPGAASNVKKFCERYENALCIPLYLSWRDGAHWPEGGITA